MVARDLGRVRRTAPDRGPRLTGKLPSSEAPVERPDRAQGTVMQGDRRKAYRPIPPDLRRAALESGLAAFGRGDFFLAHELLEPAWMGTSDLAERALYQGLIKLAAAYVHAVRGNPIGFARNLRGAREHLETSRRLDPAVADEFGIDLPVLIPKVEARLAAVATVTEALAEARGPLIDLLPPPPQIR